MSIEHVLAVVPVADIERADAWYQALLGRPADNRPMPTLVEWQVTSAAWVQVTVDAERAGAAQLNRAVDDLATTKDELAGRGLPTGEIQSASKGVELASASPARTSNSPSCCCNDRSNPPIRQWDSMSEGVWLCWWTTIPP